MTNARKYGAKMDFTQRFMIGCGTDTEVTMDIPNEVTIYLYQDMDNMSSHFCHIYDRELHRMTDGSMWRMAFLRGKDPLDEDIWRKW